MRCKACDNELKRNEGKWNPLLGSHDELCTKCKRVGTHIEEKPNDLDLVVPTIVPKELD